MIYKIHRGIIKFLCLILGFTGIHRFLIGSKNIFVLYVSFLILVPISLETFEIYDEKYYNYYGIFIILFWLIENLRFNEIYNHYMKINEKKVINNDESNTNISVKKKSIIGKPKETKVRIDINNATIYELKSLPHITDIDANKIKNYTDKKNFKNIYDFQGYLGLSKEQTQILMKHIKIKKTKKSKKQNKNVIEDIKKKDRNRILDI